MNEFNIFGRLVFKWRGLAFVLMAERAFQRILLKGRAKDIGILRPPYLTTEKLHFLSANKEFRNYRAALHAGQTKMTQHMSNLRGHLRGISKDHPNNASVYIHKIKRLAN